MRDQVDPFPIAAIDRTEDTVAKSGCVFDDSFENRLQFGRRTTSNAKYLRHRRLLLQRLGKVSPRLGKVRPRLAEFAPA